VYNVQVTQEISDKPKGCRCPNCPERLGTGVCACCEDRRLSEQFPDPPDTLIGDSAPPESFDNTPTDPIGVPFVDLMELHGVEPKPRTHKQFVEASKRDAYRSSHEHINQVTFEDAWRVATQLDAGLPLYPPEDTKDSAKRAILGLARRVVELEHEWS
jgi:hypothetical protein